MQIWRAFWVSSLEIERQRKRRRTPPVISIAKIRFKNDDLPFTNYDRKSVSRFGVAHHHVYCLVSQRLSIFHNIHGRLAFERHPGRPADQSEREKPENMTHFGGEKETE